MRDARRYRATITVEVVAPSRVEAERIILAGMRTLEQSTEPKVQAVFPLPEARVVVK